MTEQQRSGAAFVPASVLLAVSLVVLAAQIYWGLQPNYGYDEAWHVYLASITPAWKFLLAATGDPHPPLYYLLLRPFVALGMEPSYPRLLSTVPNVLTIPLVYALLRKVKVRVSIALVTIVLLACAVSFEQIGITVRSYSLTVLFLLGGLWFWLDLFPGSNGRPSRLSGVASLALFSLAFGCLYAAAFVTAAVFGATLLVMVLSTSNAAAIRENLRRYSGWPEWLGFFLVHAAGTAWFYMGWVRHRNLQTPDYLSEFGLKPGQPIVEFLHHNLRNELALFIPLDGFPNWALDSALLLVFAVIVWLTIASLRDGKPVRAILALIPLLLTAILALLAVLNKYPFGGAARHQYILFPFLLFLVPLVLDVLWAYMKYRLIQVAVTATIIGIALVSPVQQHRALLKGEAPSEPWFADEFEVLFKSSSQDPVLFPGFALFPAYLNRLDVGIDYSTSFQLSRDCAYVAYQGWLAALLIWPSYEVYTSKANDGGPITLVKDQYRWDLAPIPDKEFFTELDQLLRRMDKTAVTVFAFQNADVFQQDPEGLRGMAARHGYTLTSYINTDNGAIWRIQQIPMKANPSSPPPLSCAPHTDSDNYS